MEENETMWNVIENLTILTDCDKLNEESKIKQRAEIRKKASPKKD